MLNFIPVIYVSVRLGNRGFDRHVLKHGLVWSHLVGLILLVWSVLYGLFIIVLIFFVLIFTILFNFMVIMMLLFWCVRNSHSNDLYQHFLYFILILYISIPFHRLLTTLGQDLLRNIRGMFGVDTCSHS